MRQVAIDEIERLKKLREFHKATYKELEAATDDDDIRRLKKDLENLGIAIKKNQSMGEFYDNHRSIDRHYNGMGRY